jgi:asparagine synthase (glutamine-hydrolysing)
MCGICGEYAFEGSPVAARDIEAMSESLWHRGPDDAGVYASGRIGLGHRRLSIIDLSSNGHQPMWTEDGSHAIVFNGEVYNFGEIRKLLTTRGFRFVSTSDTEVVLKAIQCWGIEAAVAQFIGMFAFALWDVRERALYLCRDRAGVKPLFYYVRDGTLLFASEMRALYAHPKFQRDLSPRGIAQFFITGYTLGNTTVFNDTHKLLPGHYMRVDSAGVMKLHRYWNLSSASRGTFNGTFQQAADQLSDLCDSAFGHRLIADVPVGLFLSGGIDSSLVAAVLKRRRDADLVHITIGFNEQLYDESEKASIVAKHLGVRHIVRRVDAPDAREALLRFVDVYDEPFGDTSGIPMWILSKMAREHVKVALSADGGDEQFCGYEGYAGYGRAHTRTNRLSPLLRHVASAVLRRFVPYRPMLSALSAARGAAWRPQLVARYEKLLDVLNVESAGDLIRVMNEKGWTEDTVRDVLRPSVTDILKDTALDGTHAAGNEDEFIDSMMRTDYSTFMRDDVLTKVDRASMSVSLECRDPFLDHRLTEFAFSLPLDYLYANGEHKRILKHLLRPWLPESVVSAPKRGFSIPLYEWLRGPWKSIVHEYLSADRVRAIGVLNEHQVAREVSTFYRYQGCRAEKIMLMLNFQMWAEKWLASPRPRSLERPGAATLQNVTS